MSTQNRCDEIDAECLDGGHCGSAELMDAHIDEALRARFMFIIHCGVGPCVGLHKATVRHSRDKEGRWNLTAKLSDGGPLSRGEVHSG